MIFGIGVLACFADQTFLVRTRHDHQRCVAIVDVIEKHRNHDAIGTRHAIDPMIGAIVLMPVNNRAAVLFDVDARLMHIKRAAQQLFGITDQLRMPAQRPKAIIKPVHAVNHMRRAVFFNHALRTITLRHLGDGLIEYLQLGRAQQAGYQHKATLRVFMHLCVSQCHLENLIIELAIARWPEKLRPAPGQVPAGR